MANQSQTSPERLIKEAESRGISGGRNVSMLTAIWAISVAAAGGLHKDDPDDWHVCQVCGLSHRRVP